MRKVLKNIRNIESLSEEEKENIQLVCLFIDFPTAIIGGGCADAGNWIGAIVCMAIMVVLLYFMAVTAEEESE